MITPALHFPAPFLHFTFSQSPLLQHDSAFPTVVGYQSVAQYRTGKNFIGATFAKVDGSDLKLKDFKPNGDFAPMGDFISVLNEYGGRVGGPIVYMDADTASDYQTDYPSFAAAFKEGWWDSAELDSWDEESDPTSFYKGDTDLYQGQTVMVEASDTAAGLQFDGQVDSEDINLTANEVTAGNKKTFLCNCTPSQITVGQILPNEDFEPMSHFISFLNDQGGRIGPYVYMDDDTANDYKTDYPSFATAFKAGWWNSNELDNWDEESDPSSFCINDQILTSGAGFMMEVPTAGAGVIIPSAL